jgi:hypothetical protein
MQLVLCEYAASQQLGKQATLKVINMTFLQVTKKA